MDRPARAEPNRADLRLWGSHPSRGQCTCTQPKVGKSHSYCPCLTLDVSLGLSSSQSSTHAYTHCIHTLHTHTDTKPLRRSAAPKNSPSSTASPFSCHTSLVLPPPTRSNHVSSSPSTPPPSASPQPPATHLSPALISSSHVPHTFCVPSIPCSPARHANVRTTHPAAGVRSPHHLAVAP